MFTFIRMMGDEPITAVALALSILSDLIFVGALYWAHCAEEKKKEEND